MIGGWSLGSQVGPYRLERELGRGGMGVVFLAQDTESGAAVVVKTLTIADPDEVARLEREGLALARLEHPNLIRVHGAGWHERRPYLVLQLAAGGSLADRLQRGPLPWPEAVELVSKLASALAAAHAVGIRHRDIKPENVLIDERGNPLLADFGLAKVSDLSRLTETGALLGTPRYMAPEQAIGSDSGEAADVYSLGAVLFAALAGRPPVVPEGTGVVAQLMALQDTSPPPLSSLVPDVPRWLEQAAQAALARRPEERPSAQEFADLLRATSGGSRASQPSRLVLGLVGSGVVALLVGGAFLARSASEGPTPTPTPTPSPSPSVSPQVAAPSPPEPAPGPFRAQAQLRGELLEALAQLKETSSRAKGLTPEDRAFFASLEGRSVLELAPIARDYANTRDLVRERHAKWAALELSLRGHFDWLVPAFRGVLDVRRALPLAARLARSGDVRAQWLLRRIKMSEASSEAFLVYQDSHYYLSRATSLSHRRVTGPLLLHSGWKQSQSTPLPRHVGEAWLRVYDFEGIPKTSREHRRARAALAETRPEDALAHYLAAWRGRTQDSEALAFELMVAAEWSWSRHLRLLGHPYTEGAPLPDRPLSVEQLRAEIEEVLGQVEWGRAYYLLALTHLPDRKPWVPSVVPPDLDSLEAAVSRALELNPAQPPARLLLAHIQRWKGDRAAARAEYEVFDATTGLWRGHGLLFHALLLLEACRESEQPLTKEAQEAYRSALEDTRELKLSWVQHYLTPLYRELEQRR